jgi:hypothetical protein
LRIVDEFHARIVAEIARQTTLESPSGGQSPVDLGRQIATPLRRERELSAGQHTGVASRVVGRLSRGAGSVDVVIELGVHEGQRTFKSQPIIDNEGTRCLDAPSLGRSGVSGEERETA